MCVLEMRADTCMDLCMGRVHRANCQIGMCIDMCMDLSMDMGVASLADMSVDVLKKNKKKCVWARDMRDDVRIGVRIDVRTRGARKSKALEDGRVILIPTCCTSLQTYVYTCMCTCLHTYTLNGDGMLPELT